MTTKNYTPISAGAAADDTTFNPPLDQLDAAIGDLTTLNTSPKTSVVAAVGTAAPTTTAKTLSGAINELDADTATLLADIGNIATLATATKTSTVAAINELFGIYSVPPIVATRVLNAGKDYASFTDYSNLNGGTLAAGRTFLFEKIARRMRQTGFIRQVKAYWHSIAGGKTAKFKVFRPNGTNYDFVSESESFVPGATGLVTYDLTQPMACVIGDVLGIWLEGNAGAYLSLTSMPENTIYVDGDITGTNVYFTSTVPNVCMDIEGLIDPPFLAVTGDSIAEGHGGATPYESWYDTGPLAPSTHEIWHQLVGKIRPTMSYQNHAKGDQTFAWVLSSGIVTTLWALPRCILIHCGVNDVATARTWAQVLADLDAIKALITNQYLFIDEILPWTAGTDANAATIRTWNANLAAWCTFNGAVLIKCHDAMGQIRAATGQLDDMIAAYVEADGVHPNTAGVDKMADIIKGYIGSFWG